MTLRMSFLGAASLAVLLLSGCASQYKAPAEAPPVPGQVKVASTFMYPQERMILVDVAPVRLVTASKAAGKNALMIATALPRIFLGGGSQVYQNKTEMKGDPLEVEGVGQVKNPFYPSTALVQRIQSRVDGYVSQSEELSRKTFKHKLLITHGFSRLVYEELTGPSAEKYRLHVSMVAYKSMETPYSLTELLSGVKPMANPVEVDCGYVSADALALPEWTSDKHARLNAELEKAATQCDSKVAEALPQLLKR